MLKYRLSEVRTKYANFSKWRLKVSHSLFDKFNLSEVLYARPLPHSFHTFLPILLPFWWRDLFGDSCQKGERFGEKM